MRKMKETNYHTPVMLEESISGLNINPGGVYVDVTFGGGGHAAAILAKIGAGRLIAFDQDTDALKNVPEDKRLTLINANFGYLKNFLRLHGIETIDGLLADLGVSSHQIDNAERGFSTRFNGELDMRMDSKNILNAKDIVNTASEEELTHIFRNYGELLHARRVAQLIISAREKDSIATTGDLKKAVASLCPEYQLNKYLAKIFQALRIEVNKELEVLTDMLNQATEVLKPGGRLVVITYHSLEDRMVKNIMKSGNIDGLIEEDFFGNRKTPFHIISKKPITPTQEELERNSRSRSAKLRIAQKK